MRCLPFLFLLAACSTGYHPVVENTQLGQNTADFYLSSSKGRDTVHLYLNLTLKPAGPAGLHIEIKNADIDSISYKLLKIAGPTRAASMEGEHWVYYFYATPCRHFSRHVRVTLTTHDTKRTFLLKSYQHGYLLS